MNVTFISSPAPSGSCHKVSFMYINALSSSLSVVNNVQTSSPQKPLGQLKLNFMWSLLGKGEESLFKWSRSHEPLKIFSRTRNPLILKLSM